MPPWLFVAVLVSLLAALAYQIVRLRSLRRVPLYWAVVLAGFLLAEVGVDSANVSSPRLGELQILPDLLGVLVALGVLRLLRL